MLGSPRLTIDIDFIGDDVHLNPLHRTIMQIAREMQIHVEPVPWNDLSHCRKGMSNVSSVSVNLAIWKSSLLTRTASR